MLQLDFSQFYADKKGVIDYYDTVEGVIEKSRIDLTKDYPPLDFLLWRDGTGVFPKGDIQAIKGKAKSGKSTLILTLTAALLNGDFSGFTATNKTAKVLYADTEQNERNTQLFSLKLYKLCGWDTNTKNPSFDSYALRRESPAMRFNAIEQLIKDSRPDIVFIDGIRDLVADFNDISESGDIVGRLMRFSQDYNTAICVVLHENKADGNMRGHLGTEITNKCSEVYQVTNKGGIMQVTQTECRNIPVKDFAFMIGSDGLPTEWEIPISGKEDKSQKCLDGIFDYKEEYRHKDLVQEWIEREGIGERTARGRISAALESGALVKSKDGIYTKGINLTAKSIC